MILLKRYYLPILFFLFIILTFGFTGSISLWDQDEAAYAGFAKNMIESGNWIIPEFMWSEIHRKPPLHFWNIALSYKLFGINEFSVRFPSALFVLSTYCIVFFWGRKFFGQKVSLLGAIVLGTTLFVPLLAKISVTDATLLFFSTLCAFSVLQVLQHKTIWAVVVFWFSFACALLTKGPPIIIFSSIFVGLLFVFHPKRKNLLRLHPWFLLPLAVAPLVLWGYLTAEIDGGHFINWMIDWYILKRVGGSVLGQTGPPGTHILLIIGFFIPYLMFLPKAIWTALRGVVKDKEENLMLGAWFVAGWLIYEFSPSKLPAYCVVAHVPLAILIGKIIFEYTQSQTKPHKALIILQFALLLLLTAGLLSTALIMDLATNLKWILIIFNVLMISVVVVFFKLKNTRQALYIILGIGLGFQLFVHLVILPQVDVYKNSTKKVANFIEKEANKNSTVVLANKTGRPPSLPFYVSQNFDHILEQDQFSSMLKFYESAEPYVFVLNSSQKEQFLEARPNLQFHEVSSYYVDRKGISTYYILMNEWSKQKKFK